MMPFDSRAGTLDEANRTKQSVSVGLLGNAADVVPEPVRQGIRPDVVADHTSAHDPINGDLPLGWSLGAWQDKRERDPKRVDRASMATHVRAMLDFYCMDVPDGTEATASRLKRVLWNDPATGVMRHADAGYDEALACAREHQLDLPGILR